jgi:hypothetical protein
MAVPTFQFFPHLNAPIAITQAYPAVATLFLPVNYAVNEIISIRCPPACGMQQIDGKSARIIAIDLVANTVTLDLDSRGYDAFSAVWPLTQYPLTVPAGEFNTLDAAIRDNTARPGYTRV